MERQTADIDNEALRQLKEVGYWWSEQTPDLPHPKDFVSPDWDEAERRKVIQYLESSYDIPWRQFGFSWCRMGCENVPPDIGTQNLTDGVWLYPEGLVHYLRHHQVKPPEDFLQHIRATNYTVPDLPVLHW